MHTNQFIESIVRAVKGAESSPEFCLRFFEQRWWSCMTKAEWSGWMQAVFSVVAIFAAAVFTWWQLRAPRKAAELAEKRRDLVLASVALRLCERANRLARSTARDFLGGKMDDPWFFRLEGRWSNILASLDALSTKDLDGETLQLVLDSRGFAAVALNACQLRPSKTRTAADLGAIVDVGAIKRETAAARWRLRRLVRERRAALGILRKSI